MSNQQTNQPSAGGGLKDTQATEALFSEVIGLVCGQEFSDIADLSIAIFNALTGNSDPNPNYTAALNQLSGQLSNMQTYLQNLATSEVYQTECFNIESTIVAMQGLSAEAAADLGYDEVIAMCTFLSPGASADNQPDYQSAIDGLLIATYGPGVTIQSLQANTAPAMGVNTSCQAYAIANDGAGSPPGQGFYDFVQAQVNLSIAVSIMIVSITNTATQVYNCLNNTSNKLFWLSNFTDPAFTEIFNSTLTGPTMLAEVSNPTSSTYATTILGPYLINAPQGLCSYLFNIVADMSANVKNPGSTNPSFTLINQNAPNSYSLALPCVAQEPRLNLNVLNYGPLGQNSYLTPSYYNNQPGNQVLLQDPSFAPPENNYLFINANQGTPGYMALFGGNYSPGDSYFEIAWMVYMPSINNLYCCFNNSNANWAISGAVGPVIAPVGQGTAGFSIAPYDCTNSYQQFQLQLQSSNG